jgi:hypothetical protein
MPNPNAHPALDIQPFNMSYSNPGISTLASLGRL